MLYENKVVKLGAERDNLKQQLDSVNERIAALFKNEKNKKLFDAVGTQLDQVISHYDALNDRS